MDGASRGSAGTTAAAANADALVSLVMRLLEALAVTDDSPLATKRAQTRKPPQRDLDHPGSAWFSDGVAMKRITVDGVWPYTVESNPNRQAGLMLPISQYRTKKDITFRAGVPMASSIDWPV
jgi:hypothetical protein